MSRVEVYVNRGRMLSSRQGRSFPWVLQRASTSLVPSLTWRLNLKWSSQQRECFPVLPGASELSRAQETSPIRLRFSNSHERIKIEPQIRTRIGSVKFGSRSVMQDSGMACPG